MDTKNFFLGSNIHFEPDLELELREVWPYLIDLDGRPHAHPLLILEQVPGGLLIEAPLHIGLQLHFSLKLANRILLRLKEFRVRDFPKMFQQFSELKKNIFLQGLHLDFQISAKESRLNNEKRIQQILVEIFGEPHHTASQTLFVRMHDDLCTVSLDCTGTHLHKRSERQSQGAAPLRETLAAYCARRLIGDSNPALLKNVTLVDPMCGTGSLLREACSLYQMTLREDFAFLEWTQTPKILKSAGLKGNYPKISTLFKAIRGTDIDTEAVARAQENFSKIQSVHDFRERDLFADSVQLEGEILAPVWVISNPPYGERMKANFTPIQLLQQIETTCRPERVGLLLSDSQALQLENSLPAQKSSLKISDSQSFKNGGIAVRFVVLTHL